MGKNLLNMYEKGLIEDIYDEDVEANMDAINIRRNKIAGRQDSKRNKSSFISQNKKAARKIVVNTEEIEDLNKSLCGKKKRTY